MSVSPFAPKDYPSLPAIGGVRIATAEAGIRYKGRTDLLVAEFTEGTSVTDVFTNSLTASAPVIAGRKALTHGLARVLVVNSGNSNAFTGKAGEASVKRVEEAACKQFDCKPHEFFMAS